MGTDDRFPDLLTHRVMTRSMRQNNVMLQSLATSRKISFSYARVSMPFCRPDKRQYRFTQNNNTKYQEGQYLLELLLVA
jgi:hypothetical protein